MSSTSGRGPETEPDSKQSDATTYRITFTAGAGTATWFCGKANGFRGIIHGDPLDQKTRRAVGVSGASVKKPLSCQNPAPRDQHVMRTVIITFPTKKQARITVLVLKTS